MTSEPERSEEEEGMIAYDEKEESVCEKRCGRMGNGEGYL